MDITDESNDLIMICRGLPGSGKNTLAEKHDYTVVDSDSYHMEDGEYNFDPENLDEAHAVCFRRYLELLAREEGRIAVCNTNITRSEYTPYVLAARAMGRGEDIRLVLCDCSVETAIERNIHGVPPETVGAMNAKFEAPKSYDPTQLVVQTD